MKYITALLSLSLFVACFPSSARAQTSTIVLVQRANKDAGTAASATLAFNSNNTAGNWIGVCVRAGYSGQIFTVTDSRGNTYRRAAQYNVTVDTPNGHTLGIFYAENIAGGANAITVSDTISGPCVSQLLSIPESWPQTLSMHSRWPKGTVCPRTAETRRRPQVETYCWVRLRPPILRALRRETGSPSKEVFRQRRTPS